MKMKFGELSNRVLGCAIEVHRHLGPASNDSFFDSFVFFVSFVVK